MTIARTWSLALVGMDPHLVEVEVDVATGLPRFILTALSDRVLKHVEHRVHSAVTNSGEQWPPRKVTVALLPATVPKAGSRFDLPVALALLTATGALPAEALADWVVLGELSLTGAVKGVPGVLPSVVGAYRAGRRRFIVPAANHGEAVLASDAEVVGVSSLAQVCSWLRGDAPTPTAADEVPGPTGQGAEDSDLADVVGQAAARRAIEVAAAGGHHMFLKGPPGVGKTMLAERLPSLLPDLTHDEALEVTAIHSIAGLLKPGRPLISRPPFCAPHHSATTAAIVGGGSGIAAPGAISLAHRGVLFLDEAPEFGARSLDALRQPLESGEVSIHRSAAVATYPSRFLLVLAANPCPCSAGGREPGAGCSCSTPARQRYLGRLSGPLRDRVDIQVELDPVSRAVLDGGVRGEPSAVVRERVLVARDRARRRLSGTGWATNAEVPGPAVRRRWPLGRNAMRPLYRQIERGGLSTRGLDRILKLAWTLADLAQLSAPGVDQVLEAHALRTGYTVATLDDFGASGISA
jgi:magnesium chelatase family protein